MMLSKDRAEHAIQSYISTLEKERDKARKNFEEMDLENVKLRDAMELEIEKIEQAANQAISSLKGLYFE